MTETRYKSIKRKIKILYLLAVWVPWSSYSRNSFLNIKVETKHNNDDSDTDEMGGAALILMAVGALQDLQKAPSCEPPRAWSSRSDYRRAYWRADFINR